MVVVARSHTLFAKIAALVNKPKAKRAGVLSLIENLEDGYVKAVLFWFRPLSWRSTSCWAGPGWIASYRGMILLTVTSPLRSWWLAPLQPF